MRFSVSVPLLVLTGLLTLALAPSPAQSQVGDLFISQGNFGTVEEYTPTGGHVGTFVTSHSGGLVEALEFKFGPDGNLYAGAYQSPSVKVYNGATGAFQGDLGSGLNIPFDVAFDAAGNLYVSNSGNNTISTIDRTTGAVVRTYTDGFNLPTGILFDAGQLLVANYGTGQIVALNPLTGAVTPFSTGYVFPRDLTLGPDGRIYVLNTGAGQIDVIPSTGGAPTVFATGLPFGPRTSAQALVYDGGDFYVTLSDDSSPGVYSFDAKTGAQAGFFPLPDANTQGIAVRTPASPTVPEPEDCALFAAFGLAGAAFQRRRRACRK